jgi:hypothetical protein
MKSSAKTGFTLVELLIGVVMMTIVIAGIAFTVSSGFDLFTKADSNAVVISGVRFTADSFKRTVAPMLNVTDEIELLSEGSAIPASLSEDIHYVFLSNGSVVHRDSKGDHVLEGSEYIDNVEFSIPAASEDTQENYIFKMTINGKNSDHPNAKLDLDVESALYNRPEKKGTEVSGDIRGAILKVRASLYLDRLDLYDNDTKIKLNGLTVHRGTDIEAVYDLINQTGTSRPMTDESVIEWFISGSVSADLSVTEAVPTESNRNSYYWQLVSEDTPLTGKILDTTGAFHLDTEETPTDWETGVIRCRVTPVVKSAGGGVTFTGAPKWSDYVIVRKVDDPSEEFENILDVLDPDSPTPNSTGDVYLTDVATQQNENVFNVDTGQILMTIDSPSKPNYGASFVMQIKYDKFGNDRIYGAWAAGRESASDIPSYITVTNYSVILDSKIKNTSTSSALFLSTRSNNSNFGKIVNGILNNEFKDIGYAVQYSPYHYPYGFFVSKFSDGNEIVGKNKNEPRPLGIYNETRNSRVEDYYHPGSINNDNFTFGVWTDRYRVMYTVLEYYDENQGKAYPRYIFRVRLLKRTDNWDAIHSDPADKLSEIKKRDPWCVGPRFHASEPMWFGDFVGNKNTTPTSTTTTTVKVKNYNYTTAETATLNRQINIAAKIFYALKNASNATVLRKRTMNARASELNIDGSPISDTGISAALGGTVLANPESSRYVGVRGIIENNSDPTDTVTVYGLDFAPGFSINELRSIMPAGAKLYSIEETIPVSELTKIQDKDWYKSYKLMIASSGNDINNKIFGAAGKSAGTGDNGSWYYQNAGGDGGIYDLQHIKNNCNCPLHNELFKWLGGQ